jgi:hypothetical protein
LVWTYESEKISQAESIYESVTITPYKLGMKKIFPFLLIFIASCYGTRSVNQVARKKGLSVKQVGTINLFGGRVDIDDLVSDKEKPVYLFYNGDSLMCLSTEKAISNGDFIYRIQRWGDSIYMLTRQSNFRYFYEDTVLFHSDYVVSNRCVYGRNPMNKPEIIEAYFTSYHFVADSLFEFSSNSRQPVISIHQYGTISDATEQFIANHPPERRLLTWGMKDFIGQVLR